MLQITVHHHDHVALRRGQPGDHRTTQATDLLFRWPVDQVPGEPVLDQGLEDLGCVVGAVIHHHQLPDGCLDHGRPEPRGEEIDVPLLVSGGDDDAYGHPGLSQRCSRRQRWRVEPCRHVSFQGGGLLLSSLNAVFCQYLSHGIIGSSPVIEGVPHRGCVNVSATSGVTIQAQ